jgi:hypothetical protein
MLAGSQRSDAIVRHPKKPFEPIELLQMACSLTEKWNQQAALRLSEANSRALLSAVGFRLARAGARAHLG